MLEYSQLSAHDARAYFNATLCVFRDRSVGRVYVDSSDEHGYTIRKARSRKLWSPREFFKYNSIYKFPLGWVQSGPVALYIQSETVRSMKKGYTLDELSIYNPYYDFLVRLRRTVLRDCVENHHKGNSESLVKLGMLDALMSRREINQRIEFLTDRNFICGSLFKPIYKNAKECYELIRERTHGSCALSRDFAMVFKGSKSEVSLLYRNKKIGYVDQSGVKVFCKFSGLVEDLNRKTSACARLAP